MMTARPLRFLLLLLLLASITTIAQAEPMIVWLHPDGPWVDGYAHAQTASGGGQLVEFSSAHNTFALSGIEGPYTLRWTFNLSGSAIAFSGSTPWSMARLELEGKAWITEGTSATTPGDTENATLVWEHREDLAPPAPDVWFGGSVDPVTVEFTVEPGRTYTLTQWNRSRLNMWDLGHHWAWFDTELRGAIPAGAIPVFFGPSWDGPSNTLQHVLDDEYGPGTIDVQTDYEGYLDGDADPPYWEDLSLRSILVREIAGFDDTNILGWYREQPHGTPTIDGIDDGVIFEGPMGEGSEVFVTFPQGMTQFGFYLNPNGTGGSNNAPEPEHFFTKRWLNDAGADDYVTSPLRSDSEMQCLVYNISHLRAGVPSYVLAWEDNDSGGEITSEVTSTGTDNDYNDLVVEIRAASPVRAVVTDLAAEPMAQGVRLRWRIDGASGLERLEILRRYGDEREACVASWVGADISSTGTWLDTKTIGSGLYHYRIVVHAEGSQISSSKVDVRVQSNDVSRARLIGAAPNPFNPSTTISYFNPSAGDIVLDIYDAAGRHVRTLLSDRMPAGEHQTRWNGRDEAGNEVASGVYLYQLRAGASVETKRMVLLK